ncbi:MAG: diguanylate cyclase domain-containing protein [Leptospirales bacterium]
MASSPVSGFSQPFRLSVIQQKRFLLLLILPITVVSFLIGYISIYKRPHLLQKISQISLINADLQGFTTDIHFVQETTIGRRISDIRMSKVGYLQQANALLLDISSRAEWLTEDQKKILGHLRKTMQALLSDFRIARGQLQSNDKLFSSLSRNGLFLIKSLEVQMTPTLEEIEKTSRSTLFLQFAGFILFLLMTGLLLGWLSGYRRSLRKMIFYEAMSVSTGGIAFLPITLEKFQIVNKGFEELSGFSAQEIVEVVPPPIDPTFGHPNLKHEIHALQLSLQRSIEFETELHRKDSTHLPVNVRLELNSFEGNPRIVASIEDRSRQRILQQQLQDSRNHFESLVRNMGEGLLEIGPEGQILSLNHTAESLLGYSNHEISGQHFSVILNGSPESLPPETLPLPFLEEIKSTLQPFKNEEMSFCRKDGVIIAVSIVATPILQENSSDFKEAVIVFRNITPRKRIEKKLKKSEEKYRKIVRNSPDGIYLFDPDTLIILDANPIFCDMVGFFFREALIGKKITEFLPSSEQQTTTILDQIREKGSLEIEKTTYQRMDLTSIPVSLNATVIPYEEKEAILVTVRNITLQTQTEGVRRLFHELDQKILEGTPLEEMYPHLSRELLKLFMFALVGILSYGPDHRIRLISLENDSPEQKESLKEFLENMVNDKNFSSAANRALSTGQRQILEIMDYIDPYQSKFINLGITTSIFFPIALPGEKPIATIGVSIREKEILTESVLSLLEDLANKMAIAQLHENEQKQIRLQKLAIEEIDSPMFITLADGSLEWANQAYLDSKGCSFEEIDLFSGHFFNRLKEPNTIIPSPWETLHNGVFYHTEYTALKKDGTSYPAEIRITPILDHQKGLQYLICIETNLTVKKLQEAELRQKAYFDPLTQLPNRSMMEDELSRSLSIAIRYNRSMAVLFLDLDGFKEINDSFGHEVGDKLLIEVAERLRTMLRQGDFVARLGGDEFVILLNNIKSLMEVEKAAQRILNTVNQPYSIDGRDLRIGTSVGISVYPYDDKDESGLLRDADLAMYQAKNKGKNNYVIYTVPKENNNSANRGPEDPPSFKDSNLLNPLLTPIRSFREIRIVGFSLNFTTTFSTGRDLFQLSETDSIVSSDHIQEILNQMKESADEIAIHYPGAFLKATFSMQQMMNTDFLPILHSIFGNLQESSRYKIFFGVRGERALPSTVAYQKTVWDLADNGYRIGLEGVGDQENSLYLLRHLPVQFLEISQSLIRDIEHHAESMAFMSALLLMGHALQRNLLVPAVDDLETAMILARIGCDWGTGKIIGGPLPKDRIGGGGLENALFNTLSFFTKNDWDMGEIPYLIARKNHRTLLGKVQSMILGNRMPGELSFSVDSQTCPLEHWLSQNSARALLTPLGIAQIQELEERLHNTLLEFQQSANQKDKNRMQRSSEVLLAIYSELNRSLEPLEEELFGCSIPDNIY